MGSRVELFEEIRRDRDREGLSVRALADRHGVHRRTVRQALESALPPVRKRPEGRPAPALGPFRALIDGWLEEDREAPRKQRHTATRVHQRLVQEHGASVSERQVRRYVQARRRALGDAGEAFVPQLRAPGAEAEVDWFEALVILAGVARTVHLFVLRACHSGAEFAIAFARETQQAFLEGHAEALEWFGGVFATIRYDNLTSAVKTVLKGRRRVETDRFVALRSHYLFESQFTPVGLRGAHEKGGVEGAGGRLRRWHLVPVPEVASLEELNQRLRAACEADLGRRIRGRSETVGDALGRERPLLRALPAEPFDAGEEATPRVSVKALVTVRANQYSVPVGLAGLRVRARIGAREIVIRHDGAVVARHERLHERHGQRACLDHYLELLARKPGALAGSVALAQERDRGAWPACYDELWRRIAAKTTASEAARQMVDVLLLVREHGPAVVELAVGGALTAGAHDGRAVAVLARRAAGAAATPPGRLEGLEPRLTALERPPGPLDHYDRMLDREPAAR
jgi:transposase